MSRKVGLRAGALSVVLALVFAGVAAASSATPKLLSPNHQSVSPGAIRLVVNIPQAPVKKGGVFLALNPSNQKSHGHLSGICSTGCDFVEPTHWKGSKYSYVAKNYTFPGYWGITPGTYYWQVHYYRKGFTGVFYSKIGSFTVK